MRKTTRFAVLWSKKHKGYWIGGFGENTGFCSNFEGAETVQGSKEKIEELAVQLDCEVEYFTTLNLPGCQPLQSYLV
jgi:hypothetical protein